MTVRLDESTSDTRRDEARGLTCTHRLFATRQDGLAQLVRTARAPGYSASFNGD